MDLTVCICSHDRPLYVRDCLDGLRQQTVRRDRFAILLVDSASSAHAAAELTDLAAQHDARLIRLEQPGLSLARNAGAWAARTQFIAYIDDDAIPAGDWVESILEAIVQPGRRPALIGGRILPKWEAPLPAWWPASLRGVLSIIEYEGSGEYRTAAVPDGLEPYGANMVVFADCGAPPDPGAPAGSGVAAGAPLLAGRVACADRAPAAPARCRLA
jgi:glucosyl-dolichyl phosphate glucuronosyltransferase